MKHTLIMGTTALVLSACTCTCPDRQYNLQYVPQNYQTSNAQVEFLPPSHMMAYYNQNAYSKNFYHENLNSNIRYENHMDSNMNMEYRRYTQVKYSQPQEEYQYSYQQQPQQAEIIYYPVYQPMPAQPKCQDNCGCQQYSSCGC